MERWLAKHSELIYGLTRIVAGMLYAGHGAQKLLGLFGGTRQLGSPLLTAAGVIELLAGVFIMLGVSAGYAAFIASGEMAAAYFIAHASNGWFPLVNQGELAVLYCFIFLFIASKGSGRLSLDAVLPKLVAQFVGSPHVQRR